ncbi:predicted protein [Uncinocarpus reesii 1704]|uniref:Prp 4 CRoW domain-containing protein n=1 Tax=Uncinocarpus reesii (strain UAMH 1704) TaxID=336963 RepID=C4JXR6_UNCRE|nr:uncharacterized protein UREG_07854 [Uncinocarpus reesii 1704]EEP82989.1 predicted protein [Uncinocarpus reesii 1704]
MHFSSLILLSGAATAAASSLMTGSYAAEEVLKKLQNRQVEFCKEIKPPYTCARSCGAGYAECGSFPNCYNPGRGDSCCRNGKYCPSGYYCTNAGCCPSTMTLAECGATERTTGDPPSTTGSPTPPGDDDDDDDDDDSSSSLDFSFTLPAAPTRTAAFPPIETDDDPLPQPTRTLDNPFNPPSDPTNSALAPPTSPNGAGKLDGSFLIAGLGMLVMAL